MESKYNIENFERFLREKTDEFRMYPSKRVWYSIYNNMHPGNRMPSISMCIVLIFALLLVGYLHTDTSNQFTNYPGNPTIAVPAVDHISPFDKYIVGTNQAVTNQQENFIINPSVDQTPVGTLAIVGKTAPVLKHSSYPEEANQKLISNTNNHNKDYTSKDLSNAQTGITIAAIENKVPVPETMDIAGPRFTNEKAIARVSGAKTEINQLAPVEDSKFPVTEMIEPIATETKKSSAPQQNNAGKENNPNTDKTNVVIQETDRKTKAAILTNSDKNSAESKVVSLSETDKAWIEDFAMHNRPSPKKWAGKVKIQLYLTPSVVFRNLYNNATDKFPGNNAGNFNNIDLEGIVNHKPSFGVETGVSLQYDLSKRIKVKAGIQLNYTRYNVHGFENYHPIATSLTMYSDNGETAYEVFRTTPFSNAYGLTPVKLHNESYQVSLPMGADFKLAAVDKIEWYIGATIQPTIVLFGRSYLISTDRRNYVQEPSLLNRFNLNAGFETYISYKTNNYTWQLGPQFRSQIFSTNSKLYSVEERLQNYGFKIGISKRL